MYERYLLNVFRALESRPEARDLQTVARLLDPPPRWPWSCASCKTSSPPSIPSVEAPWKRQTTADDGRVRWLDAEIRCS